MVPSRLHELHVPKLRGLPSVVLGVEQEVGAHDRDAHGDHRQDQQYQQHEAVHVVDLVRPEAGEDEVPDGGTADRQRRDGRPAALPYPAQSQAGPISATELGLQTGWYKSIYISQGSGGGPAALTVRTRRRLSVCLLLPVSPVSLGTVVSCNFGPEG